MSQVNMYEAKTELSKLVRSLESGEEKIIYIARNGSPVVQMTLIPKSTGNARIGIAKGKFSIPDDFDDWDRDVEKMFEDKL